MKKSALPLSWTFESSDILRLAQYHFYRWPLYCLEVFNSKMAVFFVPLGSPCTKIPGQNKRSAFGQNSRFPPINKPSEHVHVVKKRSKTLLAKTATTTSEQACRIQSPNFLPAITPREDQAVRSLGINLFNIWSQVSSLIHSAIMVSESRSISPDLPH